MDLNSEMMFCPVAADMACEKPGVENQAGVFVVTFPSQAELGFPSGFPNQIKFWSQVISTTKDFK